ncbi:polygalacturonase-like protein [Trifolium pratense]|uniref:Polygalacturonase-like protein n=1 Tax=Trifolium pratense TaxID=57577 RepID=A0A2K3NG49_TRIPR|nr:polygalacturonase-like protein [Trifolium pratense]
MSQAFASAWKEACASTTAVKIVISSGTYKLNAIDVKGPCKAPIEVQVDGTIQAPTNQDEIKGADQWVKFSYMDSLTLSGKVVYDGQGATVWKQKVGGPALSGNKSNKGARVTSRVAKVAPILNTNIGTGDDCVSVGDGTKNLTVQNVNCGPEDNGVRVKTCPNEPATLTITDLDFEDTIMVNVKNPVIIDREYIVHGTNATNGYSFKKLSYQNTVTMIITKVSFKNTQGTSGTAEGVVLIYSSSVPCDGVELNNIDLTFNGAPTVAKCTNVKPIVTGKPPACQAPAA